MGKYGLGNGKNNKKGREGEGGMVSLYTAEIDWQNVGPPSI